MSCAKNMKFSYVVTVVLIMFLSVTNAVLSTQLKLTIRSRVEKCARDSNINPTDLKAFLNNDLTNTTTPLQCLPLCFFKALGLMDAKGNLNAAATIIDFSVGEIPAKVERVVTSCKTIKGNSACNQSYLINKCFVDLGLF